MSLFKVGEVAIIAFSKEPDYPIGMEVTILDIRQFDHFGEAYVIDIQQGFDVIANDKNLRKKRPPDSERTREQLGEWDLCPWQPARKDVAV